MTIMSESQDDNPVFVVIKDVCMQCVQDPNVESVQQLKKIISESDAEFLIPIQKYLLFPLQHILSNTVSGSQV